MTKREMKTLQLQHLNQKMLSMQSLQKVTPPHSGWIKSIRTALGMSLQQLGKRLQITRQSMLSIERREVTGSITLKALHEVAAALDMKLVYGFVPNDGNLDNLIEKKAYELAKQIVMRTHNSMTLEDQQISYDRIQKAIKERTAAIKQELPNSLWD